MKRTKITWPTYTQIELQLDRSLTLPRNLGTAIKTVDGEYSTVSISSTQRIVTLPIDCHALAEEIRQDYVCTCVIIHGNGLGNAWTHVFRTGGPTYFLLEDYTVEELLVKCRKMLLGVTQEAVVRAELRGETVYTFEPYKVERLGANCWDENTRYTNAWRREWVRTVGTARSSIQVHLAKAVSAGTARVTFDERSITYESVDITADSFEYVTALELVERACEVTYHGVPALNECSQSA